MSCSDLILRGGKDSRGTPHLPTELLTIVIELVENDEDLFALALTSRRLHTLALKHCFKTYGFNPYSKDVRINLSRLPNIALKWLCISLDLPGASIDYLSCYFPWSLSRAHLLEQIRLVERYTSKLSSIQRASISIYNVDLWSVSFLKERIRMCAILANTILERHCRDFNIGMTEPLCDHDGWGRPAGSKPSDWLQDYWPPHYHPPMNQYLKTCSISTFACSLRPFYFHMLMTNSAFITDLSFDEVHIFDGREDWAMMLDELHFPHLHHFALTNSTIPYDPLIKFLAQHPGTLSEFEYHCITYKPISEPLIQAESLEPVFQSSLVSLTTSHKHIIKFLPPLASMSRLEHLTLKSGSIDLHDPGFEHALEQIMTCQNKITLTLECRWMFNESRICTWFQKILGSPTETTTPMSQLHCVEALVIDHTGRIRTSTLAFFDLSLMWMRVCPDLKVLTLRDGRALSEHSNDTHSPEGVVAELKKFYPALHVEYIVYDDAE